MHEKMATQLGRELLVKKALLVQLTSGDEHFNRDEGLELPKSWMALVGKRIKA